MCPWILILILFLLMKNEKNTNIHPRAFPTAQTVKILPANAGDLRDAILIPGSRRSPGEGNGNPLQYSCLGNLIYRWTWRATVHGVAKSRTRLSDFTFYSLKSNQPWLEYCSLRFRLSAASYKDHSPQPPPPSTLPNFHCPWLFPL